jgi:hypothetical protein
MVLSVVTITGRRRNVVVVSTRRRNTVEDQESSMWDFFLEFVRTNEMVIWCKVNVGSRI